MGGYEFVCSVIPILLNWSSVFVFVVCVERKMQYILQIKNVHNTIYEECTMRFWIILMANFVG